VNVELKPIKTKKIYEEIVDQIKQHVKEGSLKPGDKLPSEKNLVQTFKVSRASIREAFSALESMGILEIRTGEGTYINEFRTNSVLNSIRSDLLIERSNIKELLELKKILELHAVESALEIFDEMKLGEIEKLLKNVDKDLTITEADYQFHHSIVLLSHNSLIIKLMGVISEQIIEIIDNLQMENGRIRAICNIEEHAEILSAIMRKELNIAQELINRHFVNIENEFMLKFSELDL